VDKPVDKNVDKSKVWISRLVIHTLSTGKSRLSTFLSTADLRVLGLGMRGLGGYPHIHSPYY
jgi:hypothetical protein